LENYFKIIWTPIKKKVSGLELGSEAAGSVRAGDGKFVR
jgi:hypothetical protein